MSCQTSSNYFKDIVKGTTFKGRKLTFYDGKDDTKTPKDLTGYSIVIAFKKAAGQNAVFTFKTADTTLTIPTPTNGEVFMSSRIMNYPPYNYVFDIELTSPSGVVEQWAKNYWRILSNV
jgi:hypothetical protein